MADPDEDTDSLKKEKLRAYEASLGGFELKAFEALERDFQEVLQELQQDRSLDRFRVEYEKLHRALKKSHESEKRLIKKCRELNTEILANAGKVQNALKLNEEDQKTILALKKEIDKAWKMVDASQEKEEKAKDNIQQLKIEITNLSQIIEQGTGLSIGQEKELNDLVKQKEEACRERDQQLTYIVQLRKEVTDLNEKVRTFEEQKMTMEHELVILRDQIHAKKAETERELKKKERMEKEIKELKMSLESKQNEIKSKQQTVLDGQEQVEKSEHQLREQKQLADKVQKDLDSANQKVTKLQSDLEDQIHTNTQLLAENSQKQVELKIKEDEIQAVKAEVVRVNKIREATILKLKAIEKTKEESENEKEELRNEIQSLGRDMEAQRKIAEQERKRQEELLRERDVLNKLKTQIEKEREALKQELSKSHQQIKDAEVVIASHVVNIENMNHIISEADDERFRQKKELDVIKNERDILGTQLIRRNEELSLLYEKIKIQQSTLSKGQVQYRYRLNELRLLKIKLTELKREHCVLKGSVQNIYVLKQEIHNLGRELLQERTKVKALSEELENPLNVHRWRQLEGTDPTAYEMILKIQTLQKRLILKTEQVVEKDLLIQEKEKLYVELRSILARQPGPEVAEQLGIYAKNLKEKNRQMQAMASELHMYQGQVKELKGEIQRLNAELDTVKLKFYEKKRKEQQERQKKRDLDTLQNSITPDSNGTPQPKILGGGFNMG